MLVILNPLFRLVAPAAHDETSIEDYEAEYEDMPSLAPTPAVGMPGPQ